MIRYIFLLFWLIGISYAKAQLTALVLNEVQNCRTSDCDQLDVNALKFELRNSRVLTTADSILTSLKSNHGDTAVSSYVVYYRNGLHFNEFAYIVTDVLGTKYFYGLANDAALYKLKIHRKKEEELIGKALQKLIAIDDGALSENVSFFFEEHHDTGNWITLNQNPHPYTIDIVHLLFQTVVDMKE